MTIQLIENRSEIGAGTRGASLGIDALRVASLNRNSSYFIENNVQVIVDRNELLFKEVKHTTAKRIEGIVDVFGTISSAVEQVLSNNNFPIVLAADHASAGGTIAGIKKQYPNKRLGVVWIDAHADLHSPYTSPSGNVHGMPLATALNEDNKECQVKEVPTEVAALWDELKQCEGIAPKLMAEDLIFYGVRDTEEPEDKIIERKGIKNFTIEECREKGIETVCKEGLAKLAHCDIIYISFDVDSMDCDIVSKGTGTPVPNGFTPEEANGIIAGLIQSEKLVCFEMVEINPTLDDKQNKMAETALSILESTTTFIKNK